MSERWVLVPVEPDWQAPPVPRDWLDAAVERAADAIWANGSQEPFACLVASLKEEIRNDARAAILAALEMTDEQ